jgi:hypothetical protein
MLRVAAVWQTEESRNPYPLLVSPLEKGRLREIYYTRHSRAGRTGKGRESTTPFPRILFGFPFYSVNPKHSNRKYYLFFSTSN